MTPTVQIRKTQSSPKHFLRHGEYETIIQRILRPTRDKLLPKIDTVRVLFVESRILRFLIELHSHETLSNLVWKSTELHHVVRSSFRKFRVFFDARDVTDDSVAFLRETHELVVGL